MPKTIWIDGVPYETETEEERNERIKKIKEEKKEKKARKKNEIPKYTKARKEGMDLENRFVDKWNSEIGGKKESKKYNVKQRISLDFEDDEDKSNEVSDSSSYKYSTKTPKSVPKKMNKVKKEAKRQPNSGAMWYAKGDVLLDHALVEIKERGTLNARGEKTISIPKAWLLKQEDEAFQEQRHYWYLAFAYKNDSEIYLIKPYDQEIELVHELRKSHEENERLNQLVKDLKNRKD